MLQLSTFARVSLAAVAAALCASGGEANMPSLTASQRTVWRLHGEIGGSSVSEKPNFVFSPLSVLSVFQAAQNGAAGETKKQMDALVAPGERLSLPALDQPRGNGQQVVADVANKVYVSSEVQENKRFKNYKKLLKEGGHEVERVDFADAENVAEGINSFVAAATHDHIKEIISSSVLSEQTALVLINAMYFKAPWAKQFDERQTFQGTFQTPSGAKTVTFMKGAIEVDPLLYHLSEELVAVGLPYGDPHLRMYVFVPRDLAAFEAEAASNPQQIEEVIQKMEELGTDRSFEEALHLTLPKFKMAAAHNKVDLIKIFEKLGAANMFDEKEADFSGITGDKDLYVSAYIHQADIEVDEQGTEATAATAIATMFRSLSLPKDPVNVVVDKPFLFQIRYVGDKQNLVLFSGRVADPSEAQ